MPAQRFPNGLVEVRSAVELRAAGRRLEGYASVFGVRAQIGAFSETVRAGAFRATLADPKNDIVALVDHDPSRLLARTRSGTLHLAEDGHGLHFAIDTPQTQLGQDVLELVKRGDIGGMSFGFRVTDEAWPSRDQRELRAVDLVEVSVVHAHPAYIQTSITARSKSANLQSFARRRLLAVL